MIVALVVAMDRNRVIGRRGGLPWHLPADLAFFKRTTLGHPILMGRVTHEAIGRALPGRTNIVVSRRRDYRAPGCLVAGSLDDALALAAPAPVAFVIGGGQLFRQALPRAERIFLTRVQAEVEGDVRFPELDQGQWSVCWREDRPPDPRNRHALSFQRLERRAGGAGPT